jgi:predicted site-specific integrase-resolvase
VRVTDFASHSVDVEWTEEVLGNKRYEDELVEDMLTLMSSFNQSAEGESCDRFQYH